MGRKRWSFALIVVVVCAMLAACSGGGNGTGAGAGQSAGADGGAPKPDTRKPVTLSAMVQSHPSYPFREDWMIWDVYKQLRNVTLDVSAYQGNWWETIPLIIGSGDMPDLMWMSGRDNFHKYGGEGALVDLNEHLDKMPNLKKFIDEHPDLTALMLSADGKLYMPPTIGGFAENSGIFMYRADIFEANNLNVPTTFAELKDVLIRLKQLYPDSYPMMVNKLNNIVYGYAGPFGTGDGYYYNDEKGAMAYGPMEDGFRDMVAYFAELYAAGVIPIDFLTIDSSQLNQLMTTNGSFFYYGYVDNIDSFNQAGQATNPQFRLEAMIPPVGPAGQYNGTRLYITEGLTITTTTRKLDEALEFLDWLYTEEAKEAVSWGLEGVSYEVVDGKKKYVDAITDLTALTRDFGIKSAGNFQWIDQNAWMSLLSETSGRAQEIALNYMKPRKPTPALTPEEIDAISLKRDAIGKYYQENVSKFIVGQRPMSEWDDYVQDLIKLGVNDVLAVWQGAYERQQALLNQ
jgi:putative aldouronate transport system substrate-binding protein